MLNRATIKRLEIEIAHAIGQDFKILKQVHVAGGDINLALLISDETQTFFIKLNSADRSEMLAAEVDSLLRIAATQSIRVPAVICHGVINDNCFLVLESLSLGHSGDMNYLARQLAALHRNSYNAFGYFQDNFIGLTPQANTWSNNWCDFYSESRLNFQLDLLREKGASQKLINKGLAVSAQVDCFFSDYEPRVSLVHGDLWQGNYSFLRDGTPIIYDPACYFADHETELAMMELFGHLSPEFFKTYASIFPIDSGYQKRKPLYNLYHLLNHANMFGGTYTRQAESVMDRLLEVI